MTETDIRPQLRLGEDSRHQFKRNFDSPDKLAAEVVAFANTLGGTIFVGVEDNGTITGLSVEDMGRLNQLISNTTSQKIEPPLFVTTENRLVDNKVILLIHVPKGPNKPYAANKQEFWVKNGADKRRATREELFRLLQQSRMLFADEMETDAPIDALDMPRLKSFYEMHYRELISELAIDRDQFLKNAKLAAEDRLTLAGLLLFAANPQAYRPSFSITCTSFEGIDKSSVVYRDKQTATGVLSQQHRDSVSFVTRNLRRIQPRSDGFNAPGVLEIPHEALIEAIANALVHRDYFINTPCAIEIYDNRVEIISPGSLPNTVNGENIRFGIHIERNPIILSFLERDREFAYSGRGSGIPRIISLCAKAGVGVSFVDEKESERFRIVFERA